MAALTLGETYGKLSTGMSAVEDLLSQTLSNMPSGSQMSVTDMVKLQYQMSVFTITAQTMSAVMKDMSDALKGVVQKIG